MLCTRSASLGLGFVVLYSVLAHGQAVETRTERLTGFPIDSTKLATLIISDNTDPSKTLDGAFLDGRITEARAIAQQLMCAVTTDVTTKVWTCKDGVIARPATKGLFFVVWAGKDLAGGPVLRRMLLTQPGDRPYGMDLPGVGNPDSKTPVYEIFLADHRGATLVSSYKSTRAENPLLAQIPTVATQILGPLFAISGVIMRGLPPRAPAPALVEERPATVWITANRVQLPYARASVAVSSRAQLAMSKPELTNAVAALTAQVKFEAAGRSAAASSYADGLAEAVTTTAVDCAVMATPWNACLAKFNDAFVAADKACQAGCGAPRSDSPVALSADDLTAKKAVEGKFRPFVLTLPKVVNADSTFANTPLTHYSFGTMTGFIATGFSASRARIKLDNSGKIVADPLPRPLTMIVVNWSRKGFDSASFRPLPGEVSQWFFGAVIAPDTGAGAGWSRQIIRGLAFNVGGALVFSKALTSDDKVGDAPTDSTKPFGLSVAPVGFLGVSVNFTGK